MAKKIKKSTKGIPYSKTFVGMSIIDKEGSKGIIINRDDINNVCIKYPNGWGFLCLNENAYEYEEIFKDQ